jgi:hypothetical protein
MYLNSLKKSHLFSLVQGSQFLLKQISYKVQREREIHTFCCDKERLESNHTQKRKHKSSLKTNVLRPIKRNKKKQNSPRKRTYHGGLAQARSAQRVQPHAGEPDAGVPPLPDDEGEEFP